jgi:hypothetical protein
VPAGCQNLSNLNFFISEEFLQKGLHLFFQLIVGKFADFYTVLISDEET